MGKSSSSRRFYREWASRCQAPLPIISNYKARRCPNNIADTDAALQCVKVFDAPACVIVKHANPCGVGLEQSCPGLREGICHGPDLSLCGIIAFNHPLSGRLLDSVLNKQFVEVVIAPSVDSAAVEVAKQKKMTLAGLRRTRCCSRSAKLNALAVAYWFRMDEICLDEEALQIVSKHQPSDAQMQDLLFA